MLLLGAIGWGLLAIGAVTHVWHHARLRHLVGMHLDREVVPAAVLTVVEVGLTAALPVAVATDAVAVWPFVVAAVVVAVGFVAWIARLLVTGSELPCACSFSDAPTTTWSLFRAVLVLCVVALLFATTAGPAMTVASFAVGLAIAGAIFVLPDALAWPPASKALLARAQAHAPNRAGSRP